MSKPEPERFATAHDGLVELLRAMPCAALTRLVAPLVGLDPARVELVHTRQGIVELPNFGPGRPHKAIADLVVDLCTAGGEVVRVVILEVQLGFDRNKLTSWPVLQTAIGVASPVYTVHTHLLVLAPNPVLRRKLAQQLLPKLAPRPKLIERDHIRLICDYTHARAHPHETILGAIFYSREPDSEVPFFTKIAALKAACIALGELPEFARHRYSVVIMSIAPSSLIHRAESELREEEVLSPSLEELVSETERGGHSFTLGHSEGHSEGRAEAQDEALAELRCAVLDTLLSRGFAIDADAVAALYACRHLPLLVRLCGLAHVVTDLDELWAQLLEQAPEQTLELLPEADDQP